MNVYLMFNNRSFCLDKQRVEKTKDLVRDLELETIFKEMSKGDEFLYEISKNAVLQSLHEKDEILYRQEILKDCIKNQNLTREIYKLTQVPIKKKQDHWLSIFGRTPSSLLSSSVSLMEMYLGVFDELRILADKNVQKLESSGFIRLFQEIKDELNEKYLREIKEYLKELKFANGALISAKLGDTSGSKEYILRRDNSHKKGWFGRFLTLKPKRFSHTLHVRDDAGAKVLRNIRDEALNDVASSLSQAVAHVENFFDSLRKEIAFFIGCLNLLKKLEELDEPYCFAQLFSQDLRVFSASSLYDISLSLVMDKKIVSNDIKADEKELFIITGANQGGKSTFLKSVGLAQLLVQCGMFAPAKSLKINICSALFTHFKKEEDSTMQSGKFDEELKRVSEIIDNIKPNGMILFNESFASTNEREGSLISEQIILALLQKHIKIFFVTHMYELANSLYQKNLNQSLFLRAKREKDGLRNFHMIESKPLSTSFAKDIYKEIFL